MSKFLAFWGLLFLSFSIYAADETTNIDANAANIQKSAATATATDPKATKDTKSAKSSKSKKYVYDETVHVPLDGKKWSVGYQKSSEDGSSVTRYYPEGESPQKWTQLLNIQFKDKNHVKEKNAVKIMMAEQEKSPLAKWKIISSTPDDILYERSFPSGEAELVRLVVTKKGMHRIAYVSKDEIDASERKEWVHRLKHAVIGEKTLTSL